MNLLFMHFVILFSTLECSVYGSNDSFLDIYKHPKSTWADNDIVFALNLPFNVCANCINLYAGSGYNLAPYFASAAAVAVEDINNNKNILRNHRLRYVWNGNETDTHCHELEAIRIQLKQIYIGVHGFVGFMCACKTVAKNAAAVNLPLFSMGCGEVELSNKKQYPTFARTSPINRDVIYMITSLLDNFKWRQFAVVYEETHLWQPIYEELDKLSQKDSSRFKMTLKESYKKSEAWHNNAPKGAESLAHKFGPFLDKLPSKARIVLLLIDKAFLAQFMLMAESKGLTNGEYAFFAIHPFATAELILHHGHPMKHMAWFLPWNNNKLNLINNTRLVERWRKAYQSLMIVMPEFPPLKRNEEFVHRVRSGMSKPPFMEKSYHGNMTNLNFKRKDARPPPEAARLYDAVMLYAVGLNKTIAKGENITNGKAIVENIKGMELTSILGQRFIVNGEADVQIFFDVLQFQLLQNTSKNPFQCPTCWSPKKIFKLIPNYNTSRPHLTFKLEGTGTEPYWSHGLPLDEPPCGFLNDQCNKKKNTMSIIFITMAMFVIIIVIIPVFLYRNYRLRKQLNNQLWKIDPSDLFFHDWRSVSTSSLGSLTSQSLTMNFESTQQKFTTVAIYKGGLVAIKKVDKKNIDLTNAVLLELKQMRDVRHNNLNPFIGACVDPNNILVIYHYAAKGSLEDILQNSDLKLDTLFILSLVYDIVKGMIYLHSTDIKSHGNLKSSNCVVDSRWVLKVTDYGLKTFKNKHECNNSIGRENCNNLLWRSPELLRLEDSMSMNGSQKGDIYSFAIILQECQTRDGAWGSMCQDPEMITEKVRKGCNPPFRPIVPQLLDGAEGLRDTMKRCWNENPDERPGFCEVRKDVEVMMKANGLKTNIFDNMVYMMGKYSDNLEDIVQERTSSLVEEKQKVEALLERMLPKSVARQLMKGRQVEAEAFEEVTIYFSDIVGFTTICSSISPMEVVDLLNCLYTMFDSATKDYDVYKVETIGDAYMVVSGLPVRNGKQHCKEICLFAMDILENMKSFKAKGIDQHLKIRIGIHSGPVVAGVVGATMPRYCLFGDTVNVAARMESTGEPFCIHISKCIRDSLLSYQGFTIEYRGLTKVKGKGDLETYWLTGMDVNMQRGANLKRNQDSIYRSVNLSSMYHFIRESPRDKRNYNTHAMSEYLPRPPLVPPFEISSAELARKNKKDNSNFAQILSSSLTNKGEICENNGRNGGNYIEMSDCGNDQDKNPLLNNPTDVIL